MRPDLKGRRKELKMTLEEVGDLIGVGKSTVRKWETGDIENMRRDNIKKLADALQVSPAYIMGYEQPESNTSKIDTLNVKRVPIVARVSAGLPTFAEENIVDYTFMPDALQRSDKDFFGLLVAGDSMNKEFRDGDVVIVEKDAPIENGQIGVVQVNGYNATIKRISYQDDKLILFPESTNDSHFPQVYDADSDEIKIVGRVVSSQKFY